MKEAQDTEKRGDVVLSRPVAYALLGAFVLVLGVMVTAIVALSYVVTWKDNKLEQARRQHEVLKLEMKQEITALEAEVKILRERVKVLDVIEKFDTTLNAHEKRRLAARVCMVSNTYGYNPGLILAMILTESSFDRRAVSRRGCRGLMQLNPRTAHHVARALGTVKGLDWEGCESLFDPDTNVELGAFYLANLILRFNDVQHGIQAYCDGPSRFARYLRRGRHRTAYVKTVMRNYQRIKASVQS